MDCYGNDFRAKTKTLPESWYTYAPRITEYYKQKPQSVTKLVTSVLFDVRSEHPPQPRKGGEVWIGKHGIFNGEYWGEMHASEATLFVEGYLACYRTHLSSRPEHFSQSASIYADKISDWYFAGAADHHAINAERANIPIADVLHRFADPEK